MNATGPVFQRSRNVCPQCRAVFRQRFPRCPLDGSELKDTDLDPMIGETVADRYSIEECIGEGGMGRVYRARHTRMSRLFAIKVLFGDLAADSTNRQRFEREAEAASRLTHPNLIAVVDFGNTAGGLPYLAMEFLEGRSLRLLIASEAPLDTDRCTNLLRQMASGLDHAHGRGLVHRDFKPDNVIVTAGDDGERPKILDFGIARIVEEGTAKQLTTEGVLMGTPAFMSPEQASGKAVDHRSDLFSLGMVLYEMAAGKLPFDGDPMGVLRQNLAIEPPAMSARAGIPIEPQLEHIVERLLAKEPDARFQSARELIHAIDEWWVPLRSGRAATPRPHVSIQSGPVSVTPDMGFAPTEMSQTPALPLSTTGATAVPSQRRRTWLAVIAVVAIAAGAAIAVASGLFGGGGGESTPAAGTEPTVGAEIAATSPADAGPSQGSGAIATAPTGPESHAADAGAEGDAAGATATTKSAKTPKKTSGRRPKKTKKNSRKNTRKPPAQATPAGYRNLYQNVLNKYQRLYQKAGKKSPLSSRVAKLGDTVGKLPFNPPKSELEDAYKNLRKVDRQLNKLLKRAGK